jgi:hypothetical protein
VLVAFGAGFTWGAAGVTWGERIDPIAVIADELPEPTVTGLDIMRSRQMVFQ